LILGFSNAYKLSLIEGEYRRPSGSSKGEGSEIDINGGFEPYWWDFNNEEGAYPYNLLIDRITFSGDEEPGFAGDRRKQYQIVVTVDSITWNYIGNVEG
jgi:hypothetical protein